MLSCYRPGFRNIKFKNLYKFIDYNTVLKGLNLLFSNPTDIFVNEKEYEDSSIRTSNNNSEDAGYRTETSESLTRKNLIEIEPEKMEVENSFDLQKFRKIFEGKSKIDLRAKNVKNVLEKFYNKEFLIENLRSIQEVNLGNFQNIFKNFFKFLIFFFENDKDLYIQSKLLFTALVIFSEDRICKNIHFVAQFEMQNNFYYLPCPFKVKSFNLINKEVF